MEEENSFLRNIFYQQQICSQLSFEDAVRFVTVLKLERLDCPIKVIDKYNQVIYLPGVNPITIKVYRKIKHFGVNIAFLMSIVSNDFSSVETFLKTGMDISSPPIPSLNANGSIAMMKLLLKYGMGVNSKDDEGITPLMSAAGLNRFELVKFLLANGANINETNNIGQTAIDIARRDRHSEMVKFLESVQ